MILTIDVIRVHTLQNIQAKSKRKRKKKLRAEDKGEEEQEEERSNGLKDIT